MIIDCDSCGEDAIVIAEGHDGCALTSKKAIVLCETCLDKVPNEATVAFFKNLTVESELLKQVEKQE